MATSARGRVLGSSEGVADDDIMLPSVAMSPVANAEDEEDGTYYDTWQPYSTDASAGVAMQPTPPPPATTTPGGVARPGRGRGRNVLHPDHRSPVSRSSTPQRRMRGTPTSFAADGVLQPPRLMSFRDQQESIRRLSSPRTVNGDVEELKSLFAPHGSVYSNEQIMVPAPGQYDGHAAKLKFLPSFPSFSIPKQSRSRKKPPPSTHLPSPQCYRPHSSAFGSQITGGLAVSNHGRRSWKARPAISGHAQVSNPSFSFGTAPTGRTSTSRPSTAAAASKTRRRGGKTKKQKRKQTQAQTQKQQAQRLPSSPARSAAASDDGEPRAMLTPTRPTVASASPRSPLTPRSPTKVSPRRPQELRPAASPINLPGPGQYNAKTSFHLQRGDSSSGAALYGVGFTPKPIRRGSSFRFSRSRRF